MKILFATEYYPPWMPGGSAESIRQLAEALVAAGHRVTVVTPCWFGAPVQERESAGGVDIWRFSMGHQRVPPGPGLAPTRLLLSPWFHWRVYRAILHAASVERPDVIHAQEKHALVGAWLAARWLRCPFVASIRDSGVLCPIATCLVEVPSVPADCGQRRLWTTCSPIFFAHYGGHRRGARLRLAWRYLDARLKARILRQVPVVGLSATHLRVVAAALRLSCTVAIPNLAPTWPPSWSPDQPPETPPIVLYVGRRTWGKGLDVLAQAAALIHARMPEVRIIAIGPGERIYAGMDNLEAQPLAVIQAWYRRATVVVQPARMPEPFGRVPLEAAVCRRPTVASAVGGLRETIVDGVTGYLVPPNDPPGLASAILAVLGDPARAQAMGQRAYEHVQRTYHADVVLPKLLAAYRVAL